MRKIAILTLFLISTALQAAPISYQFSGIASGSLGETSFDHALVTFQLDGDTDNVQQDFFDPGVFFSPGLSVGVSIQTPMALGLTAHTQLLDPVDLFVNQSAEIVGFAGFFVDLLSLNQTGAGLDSYALVSNFELASAHVQFNQQIGFTSLGELNLFSTQGFDFSSTLATSAVPEPSTYFLMGLGLLALVRFSKRRV